MSTPYRHGYARAGIVPVRIDASETSEMVTQLLLGETVGVLDESERWLRVRADHDAYEGWVGRSQVAEMGPAEHRAWTLHPERRRSPHQTYRVGNGLDGLTVPAGAHVVVTSGGIDLPNGSWDAHRERFTLTEHAILDTALNFRGTPYLWGGRTDTGIDCSGFVQLVFALHGYSLPRDAWQQRAFAEPSAADLSGSEAGDILYFSYDGIGTQHVGFHLGDGLVLHASGTVCIHNIEPARRSMSRYLFNERLAGSLVAVQSTHDLKTAATRMAP
jgi:hypothetical protein